MAKKKYKKGPTGVSFKGAFVYPKLSDVDYGSDDYPKKDGEFSVRVRGKLADPKVKAMIAELQPMHDAQVAKAKEAFKSLKPDVRKKLKEVTINPLYSTVYDENENETGEVEFKFAMRYSGEYKGGPKEGEKWYRTPSIFDVRGNRIKYFKIDPVTGEPKRIKAAPDIWGGTTGYVAYEVGLDKDGDPGYFIPATAATGLSLKLEAVRIVSLVSKGERSADSYGFGKDDEEGFVYGDEGDSDDDVADAPSANKGDTDATDAPASDDSDDTDF